MFLKFRRLGFSSSPREREPNRLSCMSWQSCCMDTKVNNQPSTLSEDVAARASRQVKNRRL